MSKAEKISITKEQEAAEVYSHGYREMLIENNIKESLKSIKDPVDFLMYMLTDLAIWGHDIKGINDEYTNFEDDKDMKLDYILDHLTMYMTSNRLQKEDKNNPVNLLKALRSAVDVK